MSERFDIKIDPVARIPDDDGLQLANICTKMLSRKQVNTMLRLHGRMG